MACCDKRAYGRSVRVTTIARMPIGAKGCCTMETATSAEIERGGRRLAVLPRTRDGEQCDGTEDGLLAGGHDTIVHAIQKSIVSAEAADDGNKDVVQSMLICGTCGSLVTSQLFC